MHDIWNPWHGCVKVSEGCAHCYMYYLDKVRGQADGSEIYRTANMRYPLAKDRNGNYKIRPGAAGCGIFSADEATGARA